MARRKISVELVGDARSLEKAFARASKSAGKFSSTMKNAGKIGAAGLGVGIAGAALALKRGFSELVESQKVAAQTAAVLKSTGGIANVSAKHVDKLATSLSRMSGIDDEAIAAGQNMLLTFTNVRNGIKKGDKVFDKATETILDMSVALGRDLPDVAIMVGKALNDLEVNAKGTITGWSALRRVGVKVSADMMKQAAAFIRANKPMEAQKLLLQELQTEFGGSAKAYGQTMPGALGKMRNAFDEVAAAFASGFLPLINKVAKFLTKRLADPAFVARVRELGTLIGQKLYNGLRDVGAWFEQHWPEIKSGMRTAATFARGFATALQRVVDITPGGANTLIGAIMSGVLLSKIRKVGAALALGGLVGAGGGKGKGGKGGKGLPPLLGVNPVTATLGAVLSAGGGGTNRGNRSKQFPLTWAAVMAKAKGNLGPRAWAVVQRALSGYSLANAPDENMREAERRLKKLYAANRRHNRGRGTGGLRGYPRQHGGPVMPNVAYRVGERGPETFVPNTAGNIIPAGGGTIVVPVYLDGREIARVVTGHQQRSGKGMTSQTRGRLGGQRLALT